MLLFVFLEGQISRKLIEDCCELGKIPLLVLSVETNLLLMIIVLIGVSHHRLLKLGVAGAPSNLIQVFENRAPKKKARALAGVVKSPDFYVQTVIFSSKHSQEALSFPKDFKSAFK